ncbi:hypothetical protein HP439_11870 [Sphingobacterium shayense]|uniref:hypothetical protein n=1 Tax=Sphingobacterium shayense TaxID=626343 RepID=UPI0015559DED|nr:hypothetical protein [Sphingobacterium shayense]NQD71420.1 hypothetical protein [Sphingobacterium shayense]
MKYIYLFFALFVSCTTEEENCMIVYFDNGIIDDAPHGFPDFEDLESKNSQMVFQLKNIQVEQSECTRVEEMISEGIDNKRENSKANSNAKIEAIYLKFYHDKRSLFFNVANEFYDTESHFLFKDDDLANRIRSLISHETTLLTGVDSDIPSPMYYKVKLQINHGGN